MRKRTTEPTYLLGELEIGKTYKLERRSYDYALVKWQGELGRAHLFGNLFINEDNTITMEYDYWRDLIPKEYLISIFLVVERVGPNNLKIIARDKIYDLGKDFPEDFSDFVTFVEIK